MAVKNNEFSHYILHRSSLLDTIKQRYSSATGLVVLFADFEKNNVTFYQEKSFYYMTGIEEPGAVLVMDLQGKSTLFMPSYPPSRELFLGAASVTPKKASVYGLQEIKPLGARESTLFGPYFHQEDVENLIALLKSHEGQIFTLCPNDAISYREQRCALKRICEFIPELASSLVDISPLIADMRRKKDQRDLEDIFKAVEVSALAHEAAAQAIAPEASETEIQAAAEYIITGTGLRVSYNSIVAGGKHATVLHHTPIHAPLKKGDLVVVDLGAQYNYYCADITRTYPVSGKFSKRQKELYDLVLETQEYIAGLAKPGYWLFNKHEQEKSLTHLARAYFDDHGGYGKYFTHGIGHLLGMDPHDVGDSTKPLQEGDVITIEPGLYIPDEYIGIRIEDDYWIIKDGNVCLTDGLAKKSDEIEEMVQQSFE